MNSNIKIEYLPWWSVVITGKYLCRRMRWQIDRSNVKHDPNSPTNSNNDSSASNSLSPHHHNTRYGDYEHNQLVIQSQRNNGNKHTLINMVCGYQSVCHVEREGLLGKMSGFMVAMLATDRLCHDDEFNSICRIATVVQGAVRMCQDDIVDMNVLLTLPQLVLHPFEPRKGFPRGFLSYLHF